MPWSRRRWHRRWTRIPNQALSRVRNVTVCLVFTWHLPPSTSWLRVCWGAQQGRGSRGWRRWSRGSWCWPPWGTSAGCPRRRGRSTRCRRRRRSKHGKTFESFFWWRRVCLQWLPQFLDNLFCSFLADNTMFLRCVTVLSFPCQK